MSYTLVSNTALGGGVNGATSSAIDTSGANLLVLMLAYYPPTTIPTVSDSKSNTWAPLTLQSRNNAAGRIYYVESPTVGSGHTFSIAQASSYSSAVVAAFSGAKASAVFDQENGAQAGLSTNPTGSITPSENNELIISGFSGNNITTANSADSGMTITDEVLWTANNVVASMAYKTQTTAASIDVTWTSGTGFTFDGGAVIASFKAAAGGGFFSRYYYDMGQGRINV